MKVIIFAITLLGLHSLEAQVTAPAVQPTSVPYQCNDEAKRCEKEFQMTVQDFSQNATMQCLAGHNLDLCLGNAEITKVCANDTTAIQKLRDQYKLAIDKSGCGHTPIPTPPPCLADDMKCERDFLANLAAAGNDVQQTCNVGLALKTCLDTIDGNSDCAAYKKVIADQRAAYAGQIAADGCSAPAANTLPPCAAEVTACEKNFTVNLAKAGDNAMSKCTVSFKFLSCLNVRDEAPECAASKPAINTLRASYAKQISDAGCKSTGGQCSYDVSACEDRFLHGLDMAADNAAAQCGVGASLENCLQAREADSACANQTATIKSLRQMYATQINQDGCGNAATASSYHLFSLIAALVVAFKLRL